MDLRAPQTAGCENAKGQGGADKRERRTEVAEQSVEENVAEQALKYWTPARIAVISIPAHHRAVGRCRQASGGPKDALGQRPARVEVAVCRLEVRLDRRQRVPPRLDRLPRVGRLRVGRARHLARLLGVLKIVGRVGDPAGQAAERVAHGARRGVDIEPRVPRLVQNLAVRELAQAPRVVEDVGVALAQNLGEAVRLGRVRLPVELQKPVGRRRRDGDSVAKALVEAPALLHQGVNVPEPAVNVLGAVLGHRFGGRLGLGLGKAAEGVGDAAAALHHCAHHRALLRDHRGQRVDKRVLLRLAAGRFSAAELLQVARVHGRLVHVGLEVALEGVDARIGLRRRARPPPSGDRLLLHPPALARRLLLALPPILRLLAHRLLDPHGAQHHLCQVQACLAQVLVDHVARHIVLLQGVVD